MKKKINRYTIGIKVGIESRNKYTLDELKELIYNYNSETKNNYFLSNIRREHSKLLFDKYKKVTINTTLEEIDKTTIKYNNDFELKELFNINPRTPHKMVILYRSNKEIKELDIIYKKYKYLLNKVIFEEDMMKYSKDINLINRILNNKLIEYSSRKSIDQFDYLRVLRDNLRNELPALVNTYPLHRFIDSYLYEDGKFNYYKFRLLLITFINYLKDIQKEEKEVTYKEVEGQLMFEDMAMKELKDHYEELKENLTSGEDFSSYKKLLRK